MLGCFSRLVIAASKAIPRRLVSSMCCSFRLVRSSSPRLWVTRVLVKLVCLKFFTPDQTRRLDGKTIRAATTGNQNSFYVLPRLFQRYVHSLQEPPTVKAAPMPALPPPPPTTYDGEKG